MMNFTEKLGLGLLIASVVSAGRGHEGLMIILFAIVSMIGLLMFVFGHILETEGD